VRRVLAAVLVGLALAACNGPAPAPKEAYDVAAEAMKAFDRGDWVPAARLLREAIVKQPTELRLHYSLAVADTHLELRDEAIREFQWVLGNAPAGSPEAVAARNWLIAAGVLTTPTAAGETATGTQEGDASAAAKNDPFRGSSTLSGQVSWTDGEPPVKIKRLQIFLKGIRNTPNADFFMVVRADDDGRFIFRSLPAGTFKLTDRIAGEPHWRLRVIVAAGQEATQDSPRRTPCPPGTIFRRTESSPARDWPSGRAPRALHPQA